MNVALSCEAAVFRGGREVKTEAVSVPAPKPGQIRVRLEGCGVCASNFPVWDGRPWFRYPCDPGTPGHEGWGVVESVGERVSDFAVGDRVALLSSRSFAQYDVADSEQAVRIPRELDGQAMPGEPLACAVNIFNRSDIREGQTVAIIGIGFLGALLTALCTRAGARVIGISRRPFARSIAEQFGAIATLDTEHLADTAKRARAHTPDGFERVIEAVGSQEALDLATELVGTRSKLIIAGYHQDGPRGINLQKWNWLGLDVINAHERDPAVYRRGMRQAFDLVASGAIDPAPLLTHRFPLSSISEGFDALAARPPGFLKAVVICE